MPAAEGETIAEGQKRLKIFLAVFTTLKYASQLRIELNYKTIPINYITPTARVMSGAGDVGATLAGIQGNFVRAEFARPE